MDHLPSGPNREPTPQEKKEGKQHKRTAGIATTVGAVALATGVAVGIGLERDGQHPTPPEWDDCNWSPDLTNEISVNGVEAHGPEIEGDPDLPPGVLSDFDAVTVEVPLEEGTQPGLVFESGGKTHIGLLNEVPSDANAVTVSVRRGNGDSYIAGINVPIGEQEISDEHLVTIEPTANNPTDHC